MPARWWPALHELQHPRYASLTPQLLEDSGRDLPLQSGDMAFDGSIRWLSVEEVRIMTIAYPTDLLPSVTAVLLPIPEQPADPPDWALRARLLTRVLHVRHLEWEKQLRSGRHPAVGDAARAGRIALEILVRLSIAFAGVIAAGVGWLAPRVWRHLYPTLVIVSAFLVRVGQRLLQALRSSARRALEAAATRARAHEAGLRRFGVSALVVCILELVVSIGWPLATQLPLIRPIARAVPVEAIAVVIMLVAVLTAAMRYERQRGLSPEVQAWRRARRDSREQARSRRFRGLSGGTLAGVPLVPAAYGGWSSLSLAGWSSELSAGQVVSVLTHMTVGYVIGLTVLGVIVSPLVRRSRRRRYRLELLGLRPTSPRVLMTFGLAAAVAITVTLPVASSLAGP